MQRFVYLMAKDYHTEDHDVEKKASPSGLNKAKRFNQSTPNF